MYYLASKSLKTAYSLAVLAAILPIGLLSGGWVALTMGTGITLGVPYIGPVVLLIIGAYRLFIVFNTPGALDSHQVSGFISALRKIGIFLLYVGAAVGLLNIISRPIMATLMSSRTGNGIGFYVVGVYLSLLGGLGAIGIFLFEFSRILGFENHARNQTS